MLAMAGVLALAINTLLIVAYLATQASLDSSLDGALAREAEAFEAAVAGAPAGQGLIDATRTYLRGRTSAGTGLDPILLVKLTDGRTLSNSDLRIEDAAGYREAAAHTGTSTFSYVTLDGTRYRVLSVPVSAQGVSAGTFLAAVSTDVAAATARSIALTLTAAGLVALAFGLPLSYLATRRALRPLARMAQDAERISLPGAGKSIAYDGPADELGILAESLNAMLTRLEASSQDQRNFVADASHELRTPVAVMQGNAELLRTGRLDEEDARDALQQIESEAERMARLLDEMLALARLEATGRRRFQPLSVRVLLDEAAARGRALGQRLITVAGPCDVWVSGDPDLLDQALANLVRNAVAHTSVGSSIRLVCSHADGRSRISVIDDGPGLNEADLERVFDRFHRGAGAGRDTSTGGAGLGLAITRRLVQLHEGTIRVENVEPHGASFTIELPSIAAPPDSPG